MNILVGLVGAILLAVLGGGSGGLNPIGFIIVAVLRLYMLAIIIPFIALFVRRLHDINQTGWIAFGLYICAIIPSINLLAAVAQIVIGVLPCTAGPSRYGPDPKGPAAAAADVFV